MTTMVALLRHPQTRDAVIQALAGLGDLSLRTHVGEGPGEHFGHEQPDVILVDMDFVAALAELPRAAGTAIIVTGGAPDMETTRILLRLGAVDLLPQPIDPTLLRQMVGSARRGTEDGGTVVAFLKAGGGVGATTLAVQAACALGAGAQTCLLDFDIQFGAAALHLDMEQSASLMELPDISQRFDRTLLRSAMAQHRSGIAVLAAPRILHPLDMVTPETATTLVKAAAADFRNVLVDLPLAWTAWTRATLAQAHVIVLVLRPDVPSIRQARRQIETLAAEGCGALPLITVANFSPTGLFAPGITIKEAARALGRPIDHAIPRADRPFGDAANQGLPLTEVKGGRGPAKHIDRMIHAVLAARV
jgi:pilus assembly protein CpaE